MNQAPVFLVGAQRSRTTALASVLQRAVAAVGGEFTINGKLPYVTSRWLTNDDLVHGHVRADEMVHALRRKRPYGPGADDFLERAEGALTALARRAALMDAPPDRDVAIRRLALEAYGAVQWGDKYNEYALMADELIRLWPSARVVILVRHPASVAASVLRWEDRGLDAQDETIGSREVTVVAPPCPEGDGRW